MGGVVHGPDDGERHSMGPNSVIIKATGDVTDGKFFLSEATIAPGFPGPPLHTHESLHDMFYVLDGTLTVRIEDEEIAAGRGTFVCVPPGTRHTFSNPSEAPVRFLNFNAPAGWENYMRDLADASQDGRALTQQEIGAIASRYDFKPAGSS